VNTIAATSGLSWRRCISWPYPEWWSVVLYFGAWLLLAFKAGIGTAMPGHVHHASASTVVQQSTTVGWPGQMLWWLAMVVAMMFPLLTAHVRNTAARSLWHRRHRAIGGFLGGYLGPWLVFGMAASGGLVILEKQNWFLAGHFDLWAFGMALIWQLMRAKRRSVLACHRTRPLAPTGWRADRDCLRYGWQIAGSCVTSCWALMLACMLAGHSVPTMVGITTIGLFERSNPRSNQFFPCVVIAALMISRIIW
jgi:predicted metal-binding membrane protein